MEKQATVYTAIQCIAAVIGVSPWSTNPKLNVYGAAVKLRLPRNFRLDKALELASNITWGLHDVTLSVAADKTT